jgi:pyruvate/2-oxoglutarate/acetoin dehydrogenase E1 component
VIKSVHKTGHLVVTDTAQKTGSIAGELITEVVQATFGQLKKSAFSRLLARLIQRPQRPA